MWWYYHYGTGIFSYRPDNVCLTYTLLVMFASTLLRTFNKLNLADENVYRILLQQGLYIHEMRPEFHLALQ